MPIFSAQVTNLEGIGPIIDLTVMPHPAAIQAIKKAGEQVPIPAQVSALIDTGASCCVIRESIAVALKLQPIGTVGINTPSCHNHPCKRYVVNIVLPTAHSGINVPISIQMPVIGAPLSGQNIQCLLGRDFLKLAMLVYNGPQDSFYIAM